MSIHRLIQSARAASLRREKVALLLFVAVSFCFFGSKALAQNAAVPPASDNAVTVGDPQNPGGLDAALQEAYKTGTHHIIIRPGTYLFPCEKKKHLSLKAWSNVVVSGQNVKLILDNPDFTDQLFELNACSNVTLEGMYMSQTSQIAYQGHITAITRDANGDYYFEWSPSVGYPIPDDKTDHFWISIADAKTHELNAGDFNDKNIKVSNGVYRFHAGHNAPYCRVGDYLVARYGAPPAKIKLDQCFDCTIRDVTMTHNGFSPIFESSGGGNHILNTRWTLGPRPDGATEDNIVTNAADGIHSANANPGPDIEGCTFEGIFLDDCIAIHGGYQSIKAVNGSSLTVENGWAMFREGDPARISDSKGFYLQARVTSIKPGDNNTSIINIDSQVAIPPECKASNPRYDGQGFRIIGNKLGHTRSRGIIVKADNGLIKDNVIEYASLPIRIGCEWGAGEADYSNNIIVEGNVMTENGLTNGGYILPSVMIDGSGSKQNCNILIQNNRFTSNYSGDVGINWADTVVVRGNTFIGPSEWLVTPPRSTIYVSDSQNIDIRGNHLVAASSYAQPWIKVGGNVSNLTTDDLSQPANANPNP